MRSYCIKQKKQTECKPFSERIERAKNGRSMTKSICAECGITKVRFANELKNLEKKKFSKSKNGIVMRALMGIPKTGKYENVRNEQ